MMSRALILAILCCLFVEGCVFGPRAPARKPTTTYELGRWSDLPGWDTDSVQDAWRAFLESCRAARFRAEWTSVCGAAQTVSADSGASVRAFFEAQLDPYKLVRRSGRL